MTDFIFADRPEGFDQHITRSIPGYVELREAVVMMAPYFLEEYFECLDIGCSAGSMINAIAERNEKAFPNVDFIGIDTETKFAKTWPAMESATLRNISAVQHLTQTGDRDLCFVTSLFTLQFLPYAAQQACLEMISKRLRPGGAFIIAEKTYFGDAKLQDMMNSVLFEKKLYHFDEKDILQKERDLRSMLRCRESGELEALLSASGFMVNQFWQSLHFRAYICTHHID